MPRLFPPFLCRQHRMSAALPNLAISAADPHAGSPVSAELTFTIPMPLVASPFLSSTPPLAPISLLRSLRFKRPSPHAWVWSSPMAPVPSVAALPSWRLFLLPISALCAQWRISLVCRCAGTFGGVSDPAPFLLSLDADFSGSLPSTLKSRVTSVTPRLYAHVASEDLGTSQANGVWFVRTSCGMTCMVLSFPLDHVHSRSFPLPLPHAVSSLNLYLLFFAIVHSFHHPIVHFPFHLPT